MNNNYLALAKSTLASRADRNSELDRKALAHMLTIAEFKTIYDNKNALMADYTSALFSGADPSKIGAKIDDCKVNMTKIATKHGVRLISYHCPLCNDSGYTASGDYCECLVAECTALQREFARSHGDLLAFTFADSNISCESKQSLQLSKIYETLSTYCIQFPTNNKKRVIISGNTGVGKSYLMSAVANRLIDRKMSIIYYNAFNFNNMLLKHHIGKLNDNGAFFDSVMACDALFIDDLGTEPPYNNITLNYLYAIIEGRRNKHVFLSTNLSSNEIAERYGDRILSRLTDSAHCSTITINGDNLRNINKNS